MAEDSPHALIADTITFLKELKRKEPMVVSELKPEVIKPKEKPKAKVSLPKVAVKPPEQPKPKNLLKKLEPKLEPIKPKVQEPNKMRSLLGRATPHLFLHTEVPSDRKARQINSAWQERSKMPKIPLLVSKELAPYGKFLKQLAHAIDSVYGDCRVVGIAYFEKENLWEQVLDTEHQSLILIPDVILSSAPNLLKHYEEKQGDILRKLRGVPLLLLPDLSLYLKEPLLKRSLWNVICDVF